MKKFLAIALAGCMSLSLLAGCGSSSSGSGSSTPSAPANSGAASSAQSEPQGDATGAWTPEKDFQGSVMWSAGGVCDSVSRAIAPYVKDALGGRTIVYTNRAGAGGGISTQYVHEQAADGYNLLFGAENPQIAKVMGTSELDYSNFIPINILCSGVGVVLVHPDSPYQTVADLVADMEARPGKVNMASTGPGGLPFTVEAMMKSASGVTANQVTYDGEAACVTALLGKHSEYTIITLGSCAEQIRAGNLRALAVVSDTPVEGFEDIPCISDELDGYDKYLPWGPFYGVFVHEDTPADVVEALTAAFAEGAENGEFKDIIKGLGCFPANISGEAAREYVDQYRSVTSWLMHDAGATVVSPEDAGIPQP